MDMTIDAFDYISPEKMSEIVEDEIRYAIQCKRYSSVLGNTPVQEVCAGKALYNCQIGVVMTNSRFTQAAKELGLYSHFNGCGIMGRG